MYNTYEVQDFFIEKNYEELLTWTMKNRQPPVTKEFLPPTGVIVKHNGKGIGAGFLFKTDTKMAIIGSLIIDSDNSNDVKKHTFDILITTLTSIALNEGFLVVTMAVNEKTNEDRLEQLEYRKKDYGVSIYMRDLRG